MSMEEKGSFNIQGVQSSFAFWSQVLKGFRIQVWLMWNIETTLGKKAMSSHNITLAGWNLMEGQNIEHSSSASALK